MLEYYFTKTLMVERFCELENVIMGYDFIFYFSPSILHSIKDYVWNRQKEKKEK